MRDSNTYIRGNIYQENTKKIYVTSSWYTETLKNVLKHY
jgi:hypothetical protein